MLKYALLFAIIAMIAGALRYSGVSAGASGIAKILFGLFIVVAVIFVLMAVLGMHILL